MKEAILKEYLMKDCIIYTRSNLNRGKILSGSENKYAMFMRAFRDIPGIDYIIDTAWLNSIVTIEDFINFSECLDPDKHILVVGKYLSISGGYDYSSSKIRMHNQITIYANNCGLQFIRLMRTPKIIKKGDKK